MGSPQDESHIQNCFSPYTSPKHKSLHHKFVEFTVTVLKTNHQGERGRECMCQRERERESVCVRERESVRERVCVCGGRGMGGGGIMWRRSGIHMYKYHFHKICIHTCQYYFLSFLSETFLQSHCPEMWVWDWIFVAKICAFREFLSANSLCGLGTSTV